MEKMDKLEAVGLKAQIDELLENEDFFLPAAEGIFDAHDTDKSGFIDRAELKKLLAELGQILEIPPPSDNDVENELKRLDDNKDGKISKQEFRKLVKELVLLVVDNI